MEFGICKHCKKKSLKQNTFLAILTPLNIIAGGEIAFLRERESEVFVSNLDGFSSNVLLVLQIEVLQSFSVLVLAVQLHPLGSGQLVELLLLVLHLLVSLPQLQIRSTRGHLIYRLANVVNLSLVNTEGEKILVRLLSRKISV